MNVEIYSREAAERIIAEGRFPANTAVISFYDPAIRHIDRDYAHVDYSGVCRSVFYSELEDLDLELPAEGREMPAYFFPEADEIAAFIYRAYDRGMDIICQCEYGQSRSAGCAAAILEHFDRAGITVFADSRRSPNRAIFRRLLDALERQKRYRAVGDWFAAPAEVLQKHFAKLNLPESLLEGYDPERAESAADVKAEAERLLSERGLLFRTQEAIVGALLSGRKSVYASFSAKNPVWLPDRYVWQKPYAHYIEFRYGIERIPARIWTYSSTARCTFRSVSFFGTVTFDKEKRELDAVPLFIIDDSSGRRSAVFRAWNRRRAAVLHGR